MSDEEKAAMLAAMSDEDKAAMFAAMSDEEKAAMLAAMSDEDKAAMFAMLSDEDKAAMMAAMSDEERGAMLHFLTPGEKEALFTSQKKSMAKKARSSHTLKQTQKKKKAGGKSQSVVAGEDKIEDLEALKRELEEELARLEALLAQSRADVSGGSSLQDGMAVGGEDDELARLLAEMEKLKAQERKRKKKLEEDFPDWKEKAKLSLIHI
eukprot:TRINITY_DN6200_c0_g1_i3.p1 TRINITY_DN6200_c0_g1~~TRINITY_DN6200_c0_g1_i3.p1  ORF type:complete len:209 (-),score=86.12 TRINITY_DN6200_c0_g1_i3:146-772(-)